jgi:GNAT superfamily N-acetyltransferase
LVRPVTLADADTVRELLVASWGGTTVAAHGALFDAAMLPGLLAERDGQPVGVLTYRIEGGSLEVVTIDAQPAGGGVGTALLAAAAEVARAAGCARLWLVTTNDNLDALRFYQRRGLRIAGVEPGAVARSRALKPGIPLVGAYGIPLRDEITLVLDC